LRVLPADQGFGADHLTGAHIDLGLVEETKLLPPQARADRFQVFIVNPENRGALGVEAMKAVLAGQLGLAHRLIGLTDQVIRVQDFVLGIMGNPQTGRDLEHLIIDVDRLTGGGEQTLEERHAGLFTIQFPEHRHELVASQTRDRVSFPHDLAESPRQRDQ